MKVKHSNYCKTCSKAVNKEIEAIKELKLLENVNNEDSIISIWSILFRFIRMKLVNKGTVNKKKVKPITL